MNPNKRSHCQSQSVINQLHVHILCNFIDLLHLARGRGTHAQCTSHPWSFASHQSRTWAIVVSGPGLLQMPTVQAVSYYVGGCRSYGRVTFFS